MCGNSSPKLSTILQWPVFPPSSLQKKHLFQEQQAINSKTQVLHILLHVRHSLFNRSDLSKLSQRQNYETQKHNSWQSLEKETEILVLYLTHISRQLISRKVNEKHGQSHFGQVSHNLTIFHAFFMTMGSGPAFAHLN